MKVLLTGASGFIGSALAIRLSASDVEVHAIMRPHSDKTSLPQSIRFYSYDGSTGNLIETLEESRADIVVHLASLFMADHTPDHISGLIESNVLFGCQLLEAMRRTGVRNIVNTGTCWQHYGTNLARPVNLYAATKQAFEVLLDYYHDAHDISQVTLKLCDTYGPHDKRRKLINILLQAALSGESLDMSPGEQILDLTYIDDIVSAYETAIASLKATTTKISRRYLISGSKHNLKEIVAIAEAVVGRQIQANFGGRTYRTRELMIPAYGAEPPLPGWTPEFDLKKGLTRVLESFLATHGR